MDHPGEKFTIGLDTADIDICRFDGLEDPNYQTLWDHVHQIIGHFNTGLSDTEGSFANLALSNSENDASSARIGSVFNPQQSPEVVGTQLPPFVDSAFRGRGKLYSSLT